MIKNYTIVYIMKKNNNKKYGLGKERELKKILYDEGALFVSRSRGSFGAFDLEAYFMNHCLLVSCKATRKKSYSAKSEIDKIRKIEVPKYCRKQLRVWRNRRWEIINL